MSDDGIRSDWASKDFYKELGVAKSASQDDIKKAYRKLARANHPDSHPDDTAKHEKFKAVAEAYDVIGDADKRKKYDQAREMFSRGGFPAGGGFGGGGGYGGSVNVEDLLRDRAGGGGGGFGDLFGDLFGGGFSAGRRAPRPVRGTDLETTATIGFTESLEGVTVSLRISSEGACATCRGTGGKPGTKPHACPVCEGTGMVTASVGGAFSMNETCPACGGRQLVYDDPCPTCHGSGLGQATRTIQAKIPAGVKDGQRIRLRGKGAAGENGGPAGDLYVTVKVTQHRVFGRKGNDLTVDVPVSFAELALGAEIKVPTMGGSPVTLRVPAGTPNGRTFRVRGKGAAKADGARGDLLATVEVQVPATLDAAAKAALEAYAEATAPANAALRAGLYEDAS
ncbi:MULTISPECIES: molecular chaperone DnaJ [unclassified Nocardioides]|jgi:molecular chaperone DnaJ|uniref:molecular chaperone DnaJ n=1 Tax=unclassified Nocardioides TaxID=2615069 RepID=UPI00070366B9|nr:MULTISPECIES: molecular chaperone DnaJ [unclassified Nocardioides]KRC52843.1 molecular chaperone DnaJ [Nocardioides sp. Root79]KRC72374.1 molecular chaperone DnaJ [Nocardioides sp. Root240]